MAYASAVGSFARLGLAGSGRLYLLVLPGWLRSSSAPGPAISLPPSLRKLRRVKAAAALRIYAA